MVTGDGLALSRRTRPGRRVPARHAACSKRSHDEDRNHLEAQPITGQRGREIQPFGSLTRYGLGLSDAARMTSVDALNRLLADTIALRDLYKKHHWQVSGPTFYELHRLFDEHAEQQTALADAIAERIQMLGGVAVALGIDVAELSRVERAPRGRAEVPVQISRLFEAHLHLLIAGCTAARKATELGDDGTADLVISEVVRRNEAQTWFLSEHVVDTPWCARADSADLNPPASTRWSPREAARPACDRRAPGRRGNGAVFSPAPPREAPSGFSLYWRRRREEY
jgi:starvation-inducible DNA-binding protein